jgi:hypothetical protein
MSPFWQQQIDPFIGAGRTINAGIAQLPMMRAMVANRAAQGQFYVAHAGQEEAAAEEARARAGLTDTQNQRGQLQLSAAMKAIGILQQPGALTRDDEGNLVLDKDAEQGILASVAGASTGGDDMSKGVGGLVTAGNAANQARLNREAKAALPKGTLPIDAASTATIANSLPSSVIKSMGESYPQPDVVQPGATTPAPRPITMGQNTQFKLQNTFNEMVDAGIPPAEARIMAPRVVIGTNSVPQPVVTTNVPAGPPVSHWYGADTPGTPAVTSTNSMSIPESGADQTIIGALQKRYPDLVKQLGLDTATANAPSASGAVAPQAGTATAQPQGIRVRNKNTGQLGTQLADGSVVPDPIPQAQ